MKIRVSCHIITFLLLLILLFVLFGCRIVNAEKPQATAIATDAALDFDSNHDDLPMIETITHTWSEYSCVIPKGFETLIEQENKIYETVPSSVDDAPGIVAISYALVEKDTTNEWDSDAFSDKQIGVLLQFLDKEGTISSHFVGHSARLVTDDVICYHLRNEENPNEFIGVAKLQTDKNKALILSAFIYDEKALGLFDRIVDTYLSNKTQGDG